MKSIKKQFIKILNFLSVPLQMFGVMVLYFVIEAISRHSVSEAFSYMTERPLVFLYNSFLIFTTTMLVYLVRRRVFMRVLLTIFWLGLGIINGVLLANRVTPFTGPDLHLITRTQLRLQINVFESVFLCYCNDYCNTGADCQ